MIGESARLAELSAAIRESTLKRLRLIPEGSENWRPLEGCLSFADIARHLADADEWLFRKLANPQLTGIRAQPGVGTVVARAQFQVFLDRLGVLGETRRQVLAGLREDDLCALVPDDRFGGNVSVWWVIVRGNLDHEAHHRGQLATYLRILASDREDSMAAVTPDSQ